MSRRKQVRGMDAALDPVFKVLAAMNEPADRLMAADRLEEMGLAETARLLRDPDMPPLVLCGDVLLGVRLGDPSLRAAYPLHLFNPDGDSPAVHLQAPRRGEPWVRRVDRLWVKVSKFHCRWRWYEFYNRNPSRRQDESCDPPQNNFWVLPLTPQEQKTFWAAVEAGH